MSQPILSVKPSSAEEKTTPNLLPCRVHHNGSVEPIQDFWQPTEADDGTKTAYFRGRKLQGKGVKLPKGYRGVVATAVPPPDSPVAVVDVEAEHEPVTGALRVEANFDEMVVWGHEATADAAADPYVRGMEEWLTLANQIHSYPAPSEK
ncbi:ribonuclease H2, subunit C [Diplogelasinospora grovesii]|uniref:Ribonuclease H2, subunit C n=1 Tax=Diplogelasinospora grovesii TaxID=303347 RepID=A0AAN6N6K0_9PEZI|nr:ribonuclease H2, subunit C [Diplogelasinospora grovesii]